MQMAGQARSSPTNRKSKNISLDESSLGDLDLENNDPNKRDRTSSKDDKDMLEKKEKALRSMQKILNISEKYSSFCKKKIKDEHSADDMQERVDNMMKGKAGADKNAILKELKYFQGTLRPYQVEGISWMKTLFEHGVNGILADEMGLGKTIQIIALICNLVQKQVSGPFLIIVPLSTLPNWTSEFKKFAPQIPVVVFHGDPARRVELSGKIRKSFAVDNQKVKPVVLTTAQMIRMEPKAFRNLVWKYIIVDEAHSLKNHESKIAQEVRALDCLNKILLTGTPLHNNLTELWSLLNFIMPSIFKNIDTFSSLFILKDMEDHNKIVKEEQTTNVISTIHRILAPFMLRRLKADVLSDIVPKKEVLVYCPLSKLQRTLYTYVIKKNLNALHGVSEPVKVEDVDSNEPRQKRKCTLKRKSYRYCDKDTDNDSDDMGDDQFIDRLFTESELHKEEELLGEKIDESVEKFVYRITMQNSMSMFRKVVDHPYLVHCPVTQDRKSIVLDERLVNESGKMLVLDAMLLKLKRQKHKVLIFSTLVMMLDLIEEYVLMRGYTYCRLDGMSKIEDRERCVNSFNNDPNIFIFLISTRAGGLGLNLVGADTVIFFDRDWNPQADIQAQDRCHRIGQTKPVMVFSLVTKNTIDEQIINCGHMKRRLEKIVIKNGKFKSLKDEYQIDLRELQKLLDSDDYSQIHANGCIYSDEELDKLLDRSELYKEMEERGL